MRVIFALFMAIFAFGAELKIATFNVENLFDGKNDGTEYRDFVIGKSNWNNSKYLQKLSLVSSYIRDMNADIVALQEIENERVLKEIAKKSGYDFSYFTKSKTSPFGVGVISKNRALSSSKITVANVKTRDILRVDFKFKGVKFSLFNVHFPAAKNPKWQRIAALNTLETAVKNSPNSYNIILGDFNMDYKRDNFMLHSVQIGTNLWSKKAQISSSHRSGRTIDHIFLSKNFFKEGELCYKEFSLKRYLPDRYFEVKKPISDHYGLFFVITTKDKFAKVEEKSIEELYQKPSLKTPFLLKNVAVIFTDRDGYALFDGKRGIYLFDRQKRLKVGDILDLEVGDIDYFMGNLEIKEYKISQKSRANIDKFLLKPSQLKEAKVGDVISGLEGEFKKGYLYTNYGKLRVYNKIAKLKDGYYKFNSLYINEYKGELQGIVGANF